jgi:hypothetical protein
MDRDRSREPEGPSGTITTRDDIRAQGFPSGLGSEMAMYVMEHYTAIAEYTGPKGVRSLALVVPGKKFGHNQTYMVVPIFYDSGRRAWFPITSIVEEQKAYKGRYKVLTERQ